MSYAQKQRQRIINKVLRTLELAKKAKAEIDTDKLVAEIMMVHGATRNKARAYIGEARFIVENQ